MKEDVVEVHVGSSGARIVRVGTGRLAYVDTGGEERIVDLARCYECYVARHVTGKTRRRRDPTTGERVVEPLSPPRAPPPVGFRKLLSSPPSVRLLSEPDVRFVFESRDAAYELLLEPLREDGWRTYDLD